MKKPYEKPQLIALSLKANDALCACQIDFEDTNLDRLAGDGVLFENSDAGCTIDVIGYCKMVSTSDVVFNS